MQEKNLKNYSIRTDLVVDMMDSNFTSQKIISKKETFQDIQILEVTITSDENELKNKLRQAKFCKGTDAAILDDNWYVMANILKEDIDGKKEETEITEWKTKSRNESGDTKKESVQTLAEDGLYKLRMNVTDMAGNVSHAERQLIIDKENPVIAHVDELDGKYLKKFSYRGID